MPLRDWFLVNQVTIKKNPKNQLKMNVVMSWAFLALLGFEFVDNFSININKSIGEQCVDIEKRHAVCKRNIECDYFMKNASGTEKRRISQHLCQFDVFNDPNIYNICCPIYKEVPKRKSVIACASYKGKEQAPFINEPKILHGTPAEPAEFPFFAALQIQIENKTGFGCGGVLIAKNFVLTAAHCIPSSNTVLMMRFGKTSLLDIDVDESYQKVEVGVKVRAIKSNKK